LTGSDARGDLHLAKVAGFDSSPSHDPVFYATSASAADRAQRGMSGRFGGMREVGAAVSRRKRRCPRFHANDSFTLPRVASVANRG
jgi:hypothetical protein